MKSVLEKLWFDYISDESNKISEEEKALIAKEIIPFIKSVSL